MLWREFGVSCDLECGVCQQMREGGVVGFWIF